MRCFFSDVNIVKMVEQNLSIVKLSIHILLTHFRGSLVTWGRVIKLETAFCNCWLLVFTCPFWLEWKWTTFYHCPSWGYIPPMNIHFVVYWTNQIHMQDGAFMKESLWNSKKKWFPIQKDWVPMQKRILQDIGAGHWLNKFMIKMASV